MDTNTEYRNSLKKNISLIKENMATILYQIDRLNSFPRGLTILTFEGLLAGQQKVLKEREAELNRLAA